METNFSMRTKTESKSLHSRDGARSENLGGKLVMRRATAAWRRLLFCKNRGGYFPPALPVPPSLHSRRGEVRKDTAIACLVGIMYYPDYFFSMNLLVATTRLWLSHPMWSKLLYK